MYMRAFILNEFRSNLVKVIFLAFVALTAWWLSIYFRGLKEGIENNAFTLIYPFLSLAGGSIGLMNARKWGGFRSYLGKAISMLSFGLLAQFFGQAMYSYDIYIKGIEVPYPSIGDLGYFGSVVLYIIGVALLAKVSGFKFTFRSLKGKIQSVIIPGVILAFSYFIFLRGYTFDFSNKIKIFLDFGYPLGQAIYVSIGILTLLMCKDVLGGIMRSRILFLIFALIFQYCSDFTFLYQANQGTWYVGGINDYLYFSSYFLMTLGLIYLGSALNKIKEL